MSRMHNKLIKLVKKKKMIVIDGDRSIPSLIKLLFSLPYLYRKDINTIVKSISNLDPSNNNTTYLLNTTDNYSINDELTKLGFNKLTKRHIRKNELHRINYLNNFSVDALKNLPKLQEIKNYDVLTKEDLIYALLGSKNPNESNFIKRITINLPDDDNIDNKIKEKG